jgi:tetratricopeptide (TPR) repeat protein
MRTKGSILATVCLFAFSACAQTPTASASAPAAAPETVNRTPPAAPVQLTVEQRGDIAMARKNYRDAIDYYRQAPSSAVILNKIGIAFHQQNELGQAKKHYNQAVKASPTYSEAVNNLGTVYYAEKNYRRAVKQYQKALKLSPKSASVYSNLGTAHFARKKYKDAALAYQEAVAIDPNVFDHHSSYGVLMQSTNVEERAQFHYYLAKTYAKAGINDRAIQFIRKAIEEGFKDRKKFIEEPEFAQLQLLDEFKEAIAAEPRQL